MRGNANSKNREKGKQLAAKPEFDSDGLLRNFEIVLPVRFHGAASVESGANRHLLDERTKKEQVVERYIATAKNLSFDWHNATLPAVRLACNVRQVLSLFFFSDWE